MSLPSAVSNHRYSPRLARTALIAVAAIGSLLVPSHTAVAQTAAEQPRTWELRVASGELVPTGTLRNSLRDAQVTAVQVSYAIRPSLAVTGTFGWARSRDIASVDSPKLDVFTSDIGIEGRAGQWFANHAVTFAPFAGIGAGARSYNYRSLDVNATHNVAGYGTVGGELGVGRVGLRLEVRDYTSGFKPLAEVGRASVGNDVVIMAALRFNQQRPALNK